jgi:CRISPR-associated protein Cas8a1/Csx13
LFSRSRWNASLQAGWEQVLPVLRRDWQLARDLALLGLASYAGKELPESDDSETASN